MKKILSVFLILCLGMMCSCAEQKTSSVTSTNISDSTDNNSESVEKPNYDEISVSNGKYAVENNSCVNYTIEEAKAILNNIPHFTISDKFICDIPKEVNGIKDFTLWYSPRQANVSFYKDFIAAFKYIYPDERFSEDCVFWYKETWDKDGKYHGEVLSLSDSYDVFSNGERTAKYLFYTTHEKSDEINNIFLEFASPVCNDLSNFNRGVLVDYYCKQKGIENRYFLETVAPEMLYPSVGTFTPDSEAKYTLLDGKELSIKDAVKFYEDYINTLPFPEVPTVNVRVKEVDVLKCDENTYCYLFINTVSYDGVPLDYHRMSLTIYGEYKNKFVYSMGSMAVTDEVDFSYGIPRAYKMTDEVVCDKIIDFEKAAKIISDSLSEYVTFEVVDAKFLYSPELPLVENVKIEEYKCHTVAAWKLVLYNKSDGLYYHCYVDARDGQNFRYYTTTEYMEGITEPYGIPQ